MGFRIFSKKEKLVLTRTRMLGFSIEENWTWKGPECYCSLFRRIGPGKDKDVIFVQLYSFWRIGDGPKMDHCLSKGRTGDDDQTTKAWPVGNGGVPGGEVPSSQSLGSGGGVSSASNCSSSWIFSILGIAFLLWRTSYLCSTLEEAAVGTGSSLLMCLAICMSIDMMITHLAWVGYRLVFSKRATKYAYVASCSALRAESWNPKLA